MKISVIIPTHNRPDLISKCLDALLCQQSPPDMEIMVVSDGPDAATGRVIAAKNSNLIRHLELERHRGPAAARNHGVQHSSGQLILFTDDDTIPSRDWCAAFWREYLRHDNNFIAFTGDVQVPHTIPPTDYELNTSRLETAEFVTANCAVTRPAFVLCGGFDEAFFMAWREDSDLHFRLLKCGVPIIKCPEARVMHPVRDAPWNISLRSEKKNMFNALLYKRHPALYTKKVGNRPKWHYYTAIVAALLAVSGLVLKIPKLWLPSFIIWISIIMLFTWRRVQPTVKSPRHIVQMLVTSALIPFYSIFWKLYGAFKFKKLLW